MAAALRPAQGLQQGEEQGDRGLVAVAPTCEARMRGWTGQYAQMAGLAEAALG